MLALPSVAPKNPCLLECFPSRFDFGAVPPRGEEVKERMESGEPGTGEGWLWANSSWKGPQGLYITAILIA